MLKINSLLNPMSENNNMHAAAASRPSTPAHPRIDVSRQQMATSSPFKRQKLIKDAAVFTVGPVTGPVRFPPYERFSETNVGLTADESRELVRQQKRWNLALEPNAPPTAKIYDRPRRIPYSSEKKSFLSKTGRDAFDLFQYTFVVPDSEDQTMYTVMWDYQIGLVKITPFFKACKTTKVMPAKSIKTNEGLQELSYSITGGALAAQGYWLPFACARAICLTLCYPIRWALTPLFGPTFPRECLKPEDPNYGRFKIDQQLVRDAAEETKSWKLGGASRSGTPADTFLDQTVPRSVPANTVAGKQLRPRKDKKPSFASSSPFVSDSEASSYSNNYSYKAAARESPTLSPKSNHADCAGWTSINGQPTLSPRPVAATLAASLLTEPRYPSRSSSRDAEAPTQAKDIDASAWSSSTEHPDHASEAGGSPCGSESDDVDISMSPPAKRTRLASAGATAQTPAHFTDFHAAQCLMQLRAADAELSAEVHATGNKRKASSM